MRNRLDPIVGQWYIHRDKGEMFRVVAVDCRSGGIEIQFFDADVAELDPDAWREMEIEVGEAPEDWTGPFDDIVIDDLGLTETAMSTQDWRRALESLRPMEETWLDTRTAVEREEEDSLVALCHE